MEQETEYRRQQLKEYKEALMPLLRYLPWLEKSAGTNASHNYSSAEAGAQVMSFPVYDGTLLNFVREAGKTVFMDRNYRYVYSRNRIVTHEDERRVIQNAELKDWGILCGILSKYVLGGRTKGTLWSEGVKEQIFYLVIRKMCDLIEFWDKPIGI
ncbi:MAG: hypothetical protein NC079_03835 [Clostridium sp.]|nr:hypothetical protein [Acetatifactor muris]MCM1526128.1 hypothetical protein [Bacteroides sp.]MCM1562724.1 hypothetical protein [Clostridium sp.]